MDPYYHILKSNKPDREYEYFWYNFKCHVKNICKYYNINSEFIDKYSDSLNNAAKIQKYDNIILIIEEAIILVTQIFFYKLNHNHIKLHYNFIKRWKKINNGDNNIIFFFCIYANVIEKKNNDLIKYFKNNIVKCDKQEITLLIEYSIKNKIYYILHKISSVYDVKQYIKEKYNFIHPNYDSITIEKYIKSFFDSLNID